MNTLGKFLFAAGLILATSTSYAAPHAKLTATNADTTQTMSVEAEYPRNQALIEQFNLRQQRLIEQLEADNQIEFEERVNLNDKLKQSETHSVTK